MNGLDSSTKFRVAGVEHLIEGRLCTLNASGPAVEARVNEFNAVFKSCRA